MPHQELAILIRGWIVADRRSMIYGAAITQYSVATTMCVCVAANKPIACATAGTNN
jgi:hypothetical protein